MSDRWIVVVGAVLAVLAAWFGMVVLGAVPHAHADPATDRAYVQQLARHGIRNRYGPAVMVDDGHEVCAALAGFSFAEEVARIGLATDLDGPHAVYFVRLSRETYCPEVLAADM